MFKVLQTLKISHLIVDHNIFYKIDLAEILILSLNYQLTVNFIKKQ